jgi:predicted nucleic acid-binding protein
MERQKKVIDASIIVKWFSNEEDSDKAIKLRNMHIRGEISIVVPELVFMEVMNSLRYKKISVDSLTKANKDLWDVQLETIYLDEFLLNKATEISVKYNLTVYDGIYAALAQIHGAPLITSDNKLLEFPNSTHIKDA